MRYLWTIAAACIFLAACGSDSSSSSDEEFDSSDSSEETFDNKKSSASEKANGKSSSSVAVEDLNDPTDYINKSTKSYSLDSVWDVNNKQYVQTIQFGMYIWMTENVSRNESSSNNICYEDDNDNCKDYGRLYKQKFAKNVCPTGFHVPSVAEWKDLDKFRTQSDRNAKNLDLTYDGYCDINALDEMDCSGLNKTGRYLSSGEKTYTIKKGDSKSSFSSLNVQSYYSLRCVAYSHIVASKSELPTCDSASRVNLGLFYVTQEKSNFRCSDSRWVDENSNDCSYSFSGYRTTLNDTMYICKNDIWQVASISDSRDTCTSDLQGSLLKFNGNHYVCENRSWRQFTELENAFGYCNEKKLDTFDTLETSYGRAFYICTTKGWQTADIDDYAGKCDSTRIFKTFTFDSTRYVCRETRYDIEWDKFTNIENSIGLCTPKQYGRIDSLESGIAYVCDSTGWRTATIADLAGVCNSQKQNKEFKYNDYHYICDDNSWTKLSGLEAYFGTCNEKKIGTIGNNPNTSYTYICDSTGWKTATLEQVGGTCNMSTIDKEILFNRSNYYCTGNQWRKDSTGIPQKHCLLSTLGKRDSIYVYSSVDTTTRHFICDSTGWKRLYDRDILLGVCTSKIDSTIKVYKDTTFACIKGSWTTTLAINGKLGFCTNALDGTTKKSGDTTYACHGSRWDTLSELEKLLGICTAALDSTFKSSADTATYACLNGGWKKQTYPESVYGFCTAKNDGATIATDTTFYRCINKKWVYASSITQVYTCNEDNDGLTVSFKGTTYRCSGSINYWGTLDINQVLPCDSTNNGDTAKYMNSTFVCKNPIWMLITDLERKIGFCTSDKLSKVVQDDGKYYRCESDLKWKNISAAEADLGICRADTSYYTKLYPDKWYYCNKGTWTTVTDISKVYGSCSSTSYKGPREVSLYGQGYVCDSTIGLTRWTQLTALDSVMGYCNTARLGQTFVTDSALYKCLAPTSGFLNTWTKVTLFKYMGECTEENIGEKKDNRVNTSICTNAGWTSNDSSTYTDTRDNHKYGYVSINGTNWMTSNMTYSNVNADSTWCPEGCEKNGRLYAYTTAQSVCPSGWRLPTIQDWTDLVVYASTKDTSYKYLAYAPYYGVRMYRSQFVDFFLQNGSDPMTKVFSSTRAYYVSDRDAYVLDSIAQFDAMWLQKGDSLKYFPINNAYSDGTEKGCDNGCQYQYRKTIGLPVRCIRK